MNRYEEVEKEAVKKAERRERKKRLRMKVSGKGVFVLQERVYKKVLKAKKK